MSGALSPPWAAGFFYCVRRSRRIPWVATAMAAQQQQWWLSLPARDCPELSGRTNLRTVAGLAQPVNCYHGAPPNFAGATPAPTPGQASARPRGRLGSKSSK